MPLAVGQVLQNRYRIVKLLGQGGFGAVYRAWDLNLERPRALKENLDTSPEAERQFMREVMLLLGLRHPNLPQIYDHFLIANHGQYLVMDFIEGKNLQVMIDQGEQGRPPGSPLPEDQVLTWIGQVAEALGYMHHQNPSVIHRDVKPANIIITPQGGVAGQGKAILVDFGIAKVFDPNVKTTLGARAVTPGYSPIEQYGLGRTDARSDVYSLGATLYTLLTGLAPPESTQRALRDSFGQALLNEPRLKPRMRSIISQAMQMDSDQRYADGSAFKAALEGAAKAGAVQLPQTHVTTPATQPTTSQKANQKRMTYLFGIGSLAVLILVGILFYAIFKPVDPLATPVPAPTEPIALPPPTEALAVTDTFLPPTRTIFIPTDTLLPTSVVPTQTLDSSLPPANAQPGDEWIRLADGMRMVYIPSGQFLMGANPADTKASNDEKPQHPVYLDAYWVDQTEVTNATFAQFVEQTGYKTLAEQTGISWVLNLTSDEWEELVGANWQHPQGPLSSVNSIPNHPVVHVSWNDSQAYCKWAGGRLLTEAEWEKAAGWDDTSQTMRLYPWGNQAPSGERLNFADKNLLVDWANRTIDDGYTFTAPTGSYPAGASLYGLMDMAGNVWEWVYDWFREPYDSDASTKNPSGPASGEYRVLRGAAWYNVEPEVFRVTERYGLPPTITSDNRGFRCALSP